MLLKIIAMLLTAAALTACGDDRRSIYDPCHDNRNADAPQRQCIIER
jgi:hypothetical protein